MILNDGFYFKVVPQEGETVVDDTVYYAHRVLHGYEVAMEKGDYRVTVSLSYNDVMRLLGERVWDIKEDKE